jgi:hypothetical protein
VVKDCNAHFKTLFNLTNIQWQKVLALPLAIGVWAPLTDKAKEIIKEKKALVEKKERHYKRRDNDSAVI